MFRKLIATEQRHATTILRLVLGVSSSHTRPEDARMVRWIWLHRHHGILHRNVAHSAPIRISAIAAEFFGGLV